ncbi:MAG: tetratricopeptide repeat protein [Verrucomicrobiales bacterium]|nr:tetratricopeptide repeat protein [Verrucomicrobiales bacterium]
MAKKPESKLDTKPSDDGVEALAESHAPGIVDTIEKNRVILIGTAIALFCLLAFFLVGRQLGAQRHLEAGQMYTEAATARSIEGLDKVVSEFSGSISAGNALITKADIQIDQGKSQDAISTLNTVANEFVSHPRHVQAYYMLGNLYHKSGDYEKARENYSKVLEIQKDGEYSPITKIRLGDIELAEGNKDKARQHYEESFTLYPGNPFFDTAERRIAQLKLGNPPVVDPPAPPAEAKEEAAEAPKPAAPAATEEAVAPAAPKGGAKGSPKGKADPPAAPAAPKGGAKGSPKGKADPPAAPAAPKGGAKESPKGKAEPPAETAAPEEVEAEVEVVE